MIGRASPRLGRRLGRRAGSVLCLAALVAGCDLAPRYATPPLASPGQWPAGEAYPANSTGPAASAQPQGLPWRQMISDAALTAIIERALANNQNLAATVANVASARALYRAQRSVQLPTLLGTATATIDRGFSTSAADTQVYNLGAGIASFELDLFGRLKNQTRSEFETYLASDAGMRAARITLVSETANAYVALAADRDLLAVARETVESGNRSLKLTRSLHDVGLVGGSDVSNAETIVAQAESDVASYTTQIAQDRNALDLLVGSPVAEAELPRSLAAVDPRIAVVPGGLSSTVLLDRPDVQQAEHQLKSANASIGAARAAFFPVISLTSTLGLASTALGALFDKDAWGINAAPTATLPVLGGPNRANLAYAKAQRDFYLATYRYTVQSAFREVADALARRGTIDRQRTAQARLVNAAATSFRLDLAQYRVGTGSYLSALTSQRTLYTARQSQVATIQADLQNRVSLYASLAGDRFRDGE